MQQLDDQARRDLVDGPDDHVAVRSADAPPKRGELIFDAVPTPIASP